MIEQILTQDEVDALLQGIADESDVLEPEAAPSDGIRSYDLASQERMVGTRMPNLEIVNERFARNLRGGLVEVLQKTAEVSVGEIKVQKYSAFLRDIAIPANLNIVSIRPLRGSGLVVCDPGLVFAAVDALFGGSGKFRTRIEGRDFSAIEQRVIRRIVDVVTREYGRAWAGIYPISLEYQRSEMLPQFATIASPSELVVTTAFSMEIGEMSGVISLCLPYAALEPIRGVIHSSAQGESANADGRWLSVMKGDIQEAVLELVAELAHAPTTVEQLLALAPGDFIELDMPRGIQATVAGVPVLDCHYGTSNGRYALKVDQLLHSSQSSWIGEHHGI
jgi:flagellar motor switch protein FliM